MFKVYESLPDTLKQRIARLGAIVYPFRNGVHVGRQDVEVPLQRRLPTEGRISIFPPAATA